MLYYTCRGSVRGDCDVKHRSVGSAFRCCNKDHRDCATVGGYSDRYPVAIEDGDERRLTEDEADVGTVPS